MKKIKIVRNKTFASISRTFNRFFGKTNFEYRTKKQVDFIISSRNISGLKELIQRLEDERIKTEICEEIDRFASKILKDGNPFMLETVVEHTTEKSNLVKALMALKDKGEFRSIAGILEKDKRKSVKKTCIRYLKEHLAEIAVQDDPFVLEILRKYENATF